MSAPGTGHLATAYEAGLRRVAASFVIGRGCTPVWADGGTVAGSTARTRTLENMTAKHVQVVISFGGASGTDLARSCTSPTKLTAAYQSVVTRFASKRIHFDVEGVAIDPVTQKASTARRFAAIRALQKKKHGLGVSLTVPSGPGGLEPSGTSLLRAAKRTKTRINVVSIMAMDYGSETSNMGAAAISGTQDTLKQVKTIWPTCKTQTVRTDRLTGCRTGLHRLEGSELGPIQGGVDHAPSRANSVCGQRCLGPRSPPG